MTKQQELSNRKARKQYWGVLIPETASRPFHKPDNFVDLLQIQYKHLKMPEIDKTGHLVQKII